MTVKLKYVYILLLLIVVILLVYTVQNISNQGTTSTKEIEYTRTDGYNEKLGNITQISVRINNKDTINHNYTVSSFVDSKFFSNKTIDVFTNLSFTYSLVIPIEKKNDADNVLIDDPTHSVNITVYRDDFEKPLDETEFVYN